MRKAVFTVLTILALQISYSQTNPLFIITENNKVGYIDSKGKIKIQPQYNSGGTFAEGLAPVRRNGLYGFINESGDFIINPQFDYATSFYKGIAVAWENGVPSFIDRKGNAITAPIYRNIAVLYENIGAVTTYSNKHGIIDLATKKLIIDTQYSRIDHFAYGVAIVYEYMPPGKKIDRLLKMGVIDLTGKIVVPLGKYEQIKPFNNGVALVEIKTPGTEDSNDGLINTKGELLFERRDQPGSYLDEEFSDGLVKINFYESANSDKDYEGFIDLKGQVVLDDPNNRYVNDFSNGRTFVQPWGENYILLDRNFKRVCEQNFQDILNDKFYNNHAIVETEEGWGIIDTTGKFVVKPKFKEINSAGIIDDYFFFMEDNLYGVANLKGEIICKPILEECSGFGFVDGLLQVIIDKKLAYIDRKGKIVWKQHEIKTDPLRYLNIDFMNRGYFYAYSSPGTPVNKDEPGGYGGSGNIPKKITEEKLFNKKELAVRIEINQPDTFAKQYYAYKLYIYNTTGDTVKFEAQDSRLYMKLQAQDKDGIWKDIEYLPSSWCGNSYHKIRLEPNAFWSFNIPNYKGEFPTQIRAQLAYIDGQNDQKTKIVYSNSIEGSINPGQFWNKRTYYPGGLMDPYND
jgi:hypothetical protein